MDGSIHPSICRRREASPLPLYRYPLPHYLTQYLLRTAQHHTVRYTIRISHFPSHFPVPHSTRYLSLVFYKQTNSTLLVVVFRSDQASYSPLGRPAAASLRAIAVSASCRRVLFFSIRPSLFRCLFFPRGVSSIERVSCGVSIPSINRNLPSYFTLSAFGLPAREARRHDTTHHQTLDPLHNARPSSIRFDPSHPHPISSSSSHLRCPNITNDIIPAPPTARDVLASRPLRPGRCLEVGISEADRGDCDCDFAFDPSHEGKKKK